MRSDVAEISVLTYGGTPDPLARDSFRTSADNARVARAAAEFAIRELGQNKRVNIHIPGATFFRGYAGNKENKFSGVSDAERIKEAIQDTLQRKNVLTDSLSFTPEGDALNTATQLNRIEERARAYASGIDRTIICSDWQKADVTQLMAGRLKNVKLVSDLDLYEKYFGEKGKKFANYLRATSIDKLKRDGLQSKIFKVLNVFDRRGVLRTMASKYFIKSGSGIGIADIDYRGLEKNSFAHLQTRRELARQKSAARKATA